MEPTRINTENVQQVDLENFDVSNDLFRKTNEQDALEKGARQRILQKTNGRQPSVGFVNQGLNVQTNARLSMMEKEQMYASGQWTESALNLLESWLHSCRTSSEKHAAAARACRKKHRMLSIPTIIMASLTASLAFFAAGADPCTGDSDGSGDGVGYALAASSSLSAVLAGLSALYNFNGKMEANINAAGNYANLATRAEIQIFLPNELKSHSELVLETLSGEMGHLTSSSPLL